MRNWKFGKAALLAAALALTASLSVGSALAYFTAYCTAKGGVPVNMGFTDTEIREEVIDDAKHVWIKNTGDYDCFIRVKVFAPDEIMNQITYTEPKGTDNWSDAPDADGYLYYTPVLHPGEEASELVVKYERPAPPAAGEDTRPEEFNIIVVYEYSPVFFDEDGNAVPDWNFNVFEDDAEQEGNE